MTIPAATENLDVMAAVESVAEKHSSPLPFDVWESKLKPGLKFQIKKMSNLALLDAINRLPMPLPPKFFNTDKEVEEDNPNDPMFQEAIRQFNHSISILAINTRIVLGTVLLETPDDLPRPESDEWMEALTFIGLEVPSGRYARYAAWVRWFALDGSELTSLQNAVERFNGGTLEADVVQATEEFKSPEERDSNNGASPKEDD